jgi:hypothetical protein
MEGKMVVNLDSKIGLEANEALATRVTREEQSATA